MSVDGFFNAGELGAGDSVAGVENSWVGISFK
jgi:hypothetical protein